MREIMLNLSAWIERRADNLKPYADHIIHSVKAYEAEIERLRRPEAAQVRVRAEAVNALANYQQADEEGVMVLVSRQAIEECLPALRSALPPAPEKEE